MQQIELKAQPREIIGKQVKRIRRAGLVPAIIYGPQIQPIPIQLDVHELTSTLGRAGANRLIAIDVEGDAHPHVTLARDVQRDVLTRDVLHVDFQEVVLTETITSDVPINLTGTPSIVERGEALLNQMLYSIEIEALPTDLIPSITLDVSNLEEIDDAILVSDLDVQDSVTILTDLDEMIVRISAPEMDVEELEEEIEAEELEVEIELEEGLEPEEMEEAEEEVTAEVEEE
jgi:large subunit ribosomal protein L25